MRLIRSADPEDLKGTALLRIDLNTEDSWRLEMTVPTIELLLQSADKVVIMSHKGRPKEADPKLSLGHTVPIFEAFLKKKVTFLPDFDFSSLSKTIKGAPSGSIFLLENLRFLPEEENDDRDLAKNLAGLGDYFVNDAFAVCHRANASVRAITEFLPGYAGLLLGREVRELSSVMNNPEHPLVILFGGGHEKARDKLSVIKFFKDKADIFMLGGAISNTLLKVRGEDVKKSVVDGDVGPIVEEVAKYQNLLMPLDYKIKDDMYLDIGPKTIAMIKEKLKGAKTIIWNGPFGLIEQTEFTEGTIKLATAIISNQEAFKLAGGGETVMFLREYGLDKLFSFVSTGGGAMLEYLAGNKLPGIEALEKNETAFNLSAKGEGRSAESVR